MEPFLWRGVVPCFVGSSVVWPFWSLLRVHPIVVLSLPSALISFSHPHNRFNEAPASYWCSTFPWKGFHGNGKNNADPQHCCSPPANSSLKKGLQKRLPLQQASGENLTTQRLTVHYRPWSGQLLTYHRLLQYCETTWKEMLCCVAWGYVSLTMWWILCQWFFQASVGCLCMCS